MHFRRLAAFAVMWYGERGRLVGTYRCGAAATAFFLCSATILLARSCGEGSCRRLLVADGTERSIVKLYRIRLIIPVEVRNFRCDSGD